MKSLVENINESRKLKRADFKIHVFDALVQLAHEYETNADDEPSREDWDAAIEYFQKRFLEAH